MNAGGHVAFLFCSNLTYSNNQLSQAKPTRLRLLCPPRRWERARILEKVSGRGGERAVSAAWWRRIIIRIILLVLLVLLVFLNIAASLLLLLFLLFLLLLDHGRQKVSGGMNNL